MKILASLFVAGLALGVAFGQEPSTARPKHPASTAHSKSNAPVTRSEARAVLLKMQSTLWDGLRMAHKPMKVDIPAGNAPVTRTEVVRELDRTFSLAQPSFKFTSAKVRFDPAQFTLTDSGSKARLKRLVAWGTVARLGPLACGSKPTLTPEEFGDAVGFFMSRIADLAHLPPSRWTPYLNGGRG